MRRMRYITQFIALAAIAAVSTSCGSRQGQSPAFLIIDSLQGQAGGGQGSLGVPLSSDVLTRVTTPAPCSPTSPCMVVFSDVGQATIRAALKNPGTADAPTSPSALNAITITRYHVSYRRSDGRNTQGLDVPYAWDGATTATVSVGASTAVPFELVRVVAKEETPLVNLITSATIVTTIAEVTFYGQDQAGNAVSVTGLIQVDFGNFAETN